MLSSCVLPLTSVALGMVDMCTTDSLYRRTRKTIFRLSHFQPHDLHEMDKIFCSRGYCVLPLIPNCNYDFTLFVRFVILPLPFEIEESVFPIVNSVSCKSNK